jgi:hypothetical protein
MVPLSIQFRRDMDNTNRADVQIGIAPRWARARRHIILRSSSTKEAIDWQLTN